MSAETWTTAEAKAKLSELIDRVRSSGPQEITRNGKVAAVVISPDEWLRKSRRSGSLAQFLAESPLPGSEAEFDRVPDGPREQAR
jgi:prevent-host-death family protein